MDKEPKKPVLIRESLHSRLKSLAAAQGKKLGALAETKLEELVRDQAPAEVSH